MKISDLEDFLREFRESYGDLQLVQSKFVPSSGQYEAMKPPSIECVGEQGKELLAHLVV